MGSGKQWWPWIARSDVVGVVDHVLDHEKISGPVNLVAPDFVPDPDLNERHPGHDEAVVGQRAIARTATPRDLVGAVMFLSGQGSDFVTGQSVLVNGGSHFG